MASLSPHHLRVALLPTERRQELTLRPWMTFPQMTQVLKAVGLASGLMSDPCALDHLASSLKHEKGPGFSYRARAQDDDWHV